MAVSSRRFQDSYRQELDRLLAWVGSGSAYFARARAAHLIRLAQRYLGPARHLRLLDVGCGDGLVEQFLAGSFAEVVAGDPAAEPARDLPGVRFVRLPEAGPLPFDEASFDLVFCAHVLHHVAPEARPGFTAELARVVRPGGLVVAFEHNPWNPVTRSIVAACSIDEGVRLLGPGELGRLFRQAGLEPVEARYTSFFPQPLGRLSHLERHLGWLPLGGQHLLAGRRPEKVGPAPGEACELSLVLPFYNEEKNVRSVVEGLRAALEAEGVDFELVLVNNGSSDETGPLLAQMARDDPRLRLVRVYPNQGYGWGVLNGLRAARGRVVGWMGGDGQIAPEDVVRTWRRMARGDVDLARVWRVERHDGPVRLLVSALWNLAFALAFGAFYPDVNGTPKLFRRSALASLDLQSRDWFLDAELLVEAHLRGWRVAAVPVVFHPRREGRSHVRWQHLLEFLRNLLRHAPRVLRRRLGGRSRP